MALKDDDDFTRGYISEHLYRSSIPYEAPKTAPVKKKVTPKPIVQRPKRPLQTPVKAPVKKPTTFDKLRAIEAEKQKLLKRYAELDVLANKTVDDDMPKL